LVPNYFPWLVTTEANRPSLFGHQVLNGDSQIYYLCLAGFFLVLLAVRSLRNSSSGRALIATRDNEPAARAVALNTTRLKLLAFMVSGGIAGFAGALFAIQQQGINSGSYTADINITMFSMVVIGGLGSMPGVILGSVVVWSAQYYLPSGYAALVNGGGILLVLIFLPEGLGGLLYTARDGLLRLVARRRDITAAGIWRGGVSPSPNGRVHDESEDLSAVSDLLARQEQT
jgi:branched-chain amino acid transport system permease protein